MWRSLRPSLVFWLLLLLRTLVDIMALFLAVEVLDLGEIYFFLLKSDIGTHCRWILALSTSLPRPKISVVFLFLFWVGGGSLLSGRWLFPTRCISRGSVSELILFGVFLLLFHGLIFSGAPWVYLAGTGRWLEQRLYFCIDGFLNFLFPGV